MVKSKIWLPLIITVMFIFIGFLVSFSIRTSPYFTNGSEGQKQFQDQQVKNVQKFMKENNALS